MGAAPFSCRGYPFLGFDSLYRFQAALLVVWLAALWRQVLRRRPWACVMDSAPDQAENGLQGGMADSMLQKLTCRLSKSATLTQVFCTYSEHLEKLIPGFLFASVLALPSELIRRQKSGAGSSTQSRGQEEATASQGSSSSSRTAGRAGRGGGGRKGGAGVAGEAVGGEVCSAQSRGCDRCSQKSSRGGRSTRGDEGVGGLTWQNCCTYRLSKRHGMVLLQPPAWPITCSAGHHLLASGASFVCTPDIRAQGPHFRDWEVLASELSARSVASVMLHSAGGPVAVVSYASFVSGGALAEEAACRSLAEVLLPHVQALEYSSMRLEMVRLVRDVITPLAAELSVSRGRFRRVTNARGEEVLCLNDGCAGAAAPNKAPSPRASGGGGGAAASAAAVPVTASCDGLWTAAAAPASPAACSRPGGAAPWTPAVAHADAAVAPAPLQPAATRPRSGMELTGGALHGGELDLDWSDFFFNLVSMCIVYAYFSKAAAGGESAVAFVLCLGVAAFDLLLLLIRWLWQDNHLNNRVLMCVFQVYRVVLLPVANTWMLWGLLSKMEVQSQWWWPWSLAALTLAIYMLGLQVRFFLNAPLQLVTVLLSVCIIPEVCTSPVSGEGGISPACMAAVSLLQVLLALVLPMVLTHLADMNDANHSFMPHIQAKHFVF